MMYIRNASFIKASKDTSGKRVKSSNFSQFPHLNPFSSMDHHSFLCVLTDFFFFPSLLLISYKPISFGSFRHLSGTTPRIVFYRG